MRNIFHLIALGICLYGATYGEDVWNADAYGKTMKSQIQDGAGLISMMEDKCDHGCFILDVGSGDGTNTRKLAEKFPQASIIGLEPSESMIAKALNSNEFHQIEYIKTRIEDYKEQGIFDYVTSIHVLHWLEDIQSGLKNIYQALKLGGKGYFIFVAKKDGLPYQEALEKTVAEKYEPNFNNFINTQHFYSLDEFESLLKEAGFQVDYIAKILNQRVYEDSEFLKNWVAQWCPHKKHLEPEDQEGFMDAWLENYLALGTKKDQGIVWNEYVIVVKVTKV